MIAISGLVARVAFKPAGFGGVIALTATCADCRIPQSGQC